MLITSDGYIRLRNQIFHPGEWRDRPWPSRSRIYWRLDRADRRADHQSASGNARHRLQLDHAQRVNVAKGFVRDAVFTDEIHTVQPIFERIGPKPGDGGLRRVVSAYRARYRALQPSSTRSLRIARRNVQG